VPRQVILVTGPPCAGKSHYVRTHAKPDDTILCIDTLAQRLGSPVAHNHTGSMYGNAEKQYWDLANRIARHPTVNAWIIRCAPEPEERQYLVRGLRASRCVVVLPPMQVAVQRAIRRDSDPAVTVAAIRSWYRRYRRAPFDEIVSS